MTSGLEINDPKRFKLGTPEALQHAMAKVCKLKYVYVYDILVVCTEFVI
jgi:hypothetical protein